MEDTVTLVTHKFSCPDSIAAKGASSGIEKNDLLEIRTISGHIIDVSVYSPAGELKTILNGEIMAEPENVEEAMAIADEQIAESNANFNARIGMGFMEQRIAAAVEASPSDEHEMLLNAQLALAEQKQRVADLEKLITDIGEQLERAKQVKS